MIGSEASQVHRGMTKANQVCLKPTGMQMSCWCIRLITQDLERDALTFNI